uniref:Uncharacterized protein n=1 Tax=Lotus japonicus TaxID=34305 RepID=I3SJ41_LOTJA|nr:unknown [Lotus japonicus]
MESPARYKFSVILSIIISLLLGLVSFILCIVSEFKRNKKEDLRWNGKLCYLPSSQAFGLGIAALVSFFVAQVIVNSILFKNSCSGGKRNAQHKIPTVARLLLLISCITEESSPWDVSAKTISAIKSHHQHQSMKYESVRLTR